MSNVDPDFDGTHRLGRMLEAAVSSPLARPWLRLAATARRGQSFAILKYHRVGAPGDAFFAGVDERRFAEQMRVLAATWNVLPVSELVHRAEAGTLPPLALGITFDDNYASVHELAWPVLRQLGLSAMVFVPTGPLVDGIPLWYDRVLHAFKHARADRVDRTGIAAVDGLVLGDPLQRCLAAENALASLREFEPPVREAAVQRIEARLVPAPWSAEPALSFGNVRQLREHLAEGLEVGPHSVTHPIFSKLERAQVRHELRESRRQLEDWVQGPADIFAYPNGRAEDYDEVTVQELEAAGYRAAFTTAAGVNAGEWRENRYRLVRNDGVGTPARRLLLRLAAITLAA